MAMKKPKVKSWLCAPATKEYHFEKYLSEKADVFLPDLEDSIPINNKSIARSCLKKTLIKCGDVFSSVRINSIKTIEGIKDLEYIISENLSPSSLIIPESEFTTESELISSIFESANKKCPDLYLVLETLKGRFNLEKLDSINKNVKGIILGTADLGMEIGKRPSEYDFSNIKYELALHCLRLEIQAIDSPCFNIYHEDKLIKECQVSYSYGFSGKIAIHPNQVTIINRLFDNKNDVTWASNILKNSDGGITIDNDKSMIGPPFIKLAKKIKAEEYE